MTSNVSFQVITLRKTSWTVHAFVWFFPSVNTAMNGQVISTLESFITQITFLEDKEVNLAKLDGEFREFSESFQPNLHISFHWYDIVHEQSNPWLLGKHDHRIYLKLQEIFMLRRRPNHFQSVNEIKWTEFTKRTYIYTDALPCVSASYVSQDNRF